VTGRWVRRGLQISPGVFAFVVSEAGNYGISRVPLARFIARHFSSSISILITTRVWLVIIMFFLLSQHIIRSSRKERTGLLKWAQYIVTSAETSYESSCWERPRRMKKRSSLCATFVMGEVSVEILFPRVMIVCSTNLFARVGLQYLIHRQWWRKRVTGELAGQGHWRLVLSTTELIS